MSANRISSLEEAAHPSAERRYSAWPGVYIELRRERVECHSALQTGRDNSASEYGIRRRRRTGRNNRRARQRGTRYRGDPNRTYDRGIGPVSRGAYALRVHLRDELAHVVRNASGKLDFVKATLIAIERDRGAPRRVVDRPPGECNRLLRKARQSAGASQAARSLGRKCSALAQVRAVRLQL